MTVGVMVTVGVWVAVGTEVEELNDPRVEVGVLVAVGLGVFVGDPWLTADLITNGRYRFS